MYSFGTFFRSFMSVKRGFFVNMTLIISLLCFISCVQGFAQTFSNTTVAACGTWDSGNSYSGFTRTVSVSGLSNPLGSSGIVLRQVNVQLGTSSCKGNLSTYYARLVSPQGTFIQLFGPFTTSGTSQWMNIKLRDDPSLERVRDYTTTTQQGYWPWSIGYYRTDVANAFATFNGENPNGNWTFQLAEATLSEVSFEKVELIFGAPIVVNNFTGTSANNDCAGATCIDPVNGVVVGSNNGYSPLDPLYPGDAVGGCNWNGANNNSGWYQFVASGTTAYITVSGMVNTSSSTTQDMQLVVVRGNDCAGPPSVVPTGGCPIPGVNNASYLSANGGGVSTAYLNGITANCEFSLSGLTPGQKYYLIIDGNGGASSTFYIEMLSGGSNCRVVLPVELIAFSADCNKGEQKITWTTASEVNNDHFILQRSYDGKVMEDIAYIPGNGNSSMINEYTYYDNLVDKFKPIIYYRLKQVDFDGKYEYSYYISCRNRSFSSDIYQVYFNPATGQITVNLAEYNTSLLFRVVNHLGQVVIEKDLIQLHTEIDTDNMAEAIYYYQLIDQGSMVHTGKIMKR